MRRLIAVLIWIFLVYLVAATWFSQRLLSRILQGAPTETVSTPSTDDPAVVGYRGDPMAAFGLPFQEVPVETALGPAPAWFVPGDDQAPFAAIFVHGIAGAREDGYAFLPALHRAGIPVLLIGYRKDADSPQPPDGLHAMGLTEWQDLDAAVRTLSDQGQDRILLVAASMGGAIVGQFLMQSDQASNVVGLVLDAPALDGSAIVRNLIKRLHLPLADMVAPLAIRSIAATHGIDLRKAQVTPAVAAFAGPVMLSHGSNDGIVPVESSLSLLATRQGMTVWVQSDGDHLQTSQRRPDEFQRTLAAFIATVKGTLSDAPTP